MFKKYWGLYLLTQVPPNAGENQLVETRAAFYAGAISMALAIIDADSKEKMNKLIEEAGQNETFANLLAQLIDIPQPPMSPEAN